MTRKGIIAAFALLSSAYRRQFTLPTDRDEAAAMVAVWADLLHDIDDTTGLATFRRHCETSKFPPTPADIRELAVPNTLPTPAEAWNEAFAKACNPGYCEGRIPRMSHPEIEAAARAAGWSAICFAESERELSYTRNTFLRCYADYCGRTEREQHRVAIAGGSFPRELLPRMKRVDEITS